MTQVVCTGAHPITVDDGRPLAPGEITDANLDHPNTAAQLEAGHIALVVSPPSPSSAKAPGSEETAS